MKKIILIIGIILGVNVITFAQKVGYVDTDYILSKIPEYKSAQVELDKFSTQWQKEIEARYAEIDKMYRAYEAEQILLTEEMSSKRKKDILAKENEVKELQRQRFGIDGELFKKRQALIKPIQDKVYTSIKAIARKSSYSIIFDKAGELTMLYSNPRLDKSNAVLKHMGYYNK